MDYYSVNNGWMSSKEKKEEMQEKKHGLRKTKQISFDFAGTYYSLSLE